MPRDRREILKTLSRAKFKLDRHLQRGGGPCIPNDLSSKFLRSSKGNKAALQFLTELSLIFKKSYASINQQAMASHWQDPAQQSMKRARAPWIEVFISEMHKSTRSFVLAAREMAASQLRSEFGYNRIPAVPALYYTRLAPEWEIEQPAPSRWVRPPRRITLTAQTQELEAYPAKKNHDGG